MKNAMLISSCALAIVLAFQNIGHSRADEGSVAPLGAFMGCWMSPKAAQTMVVTDAFKKDGYALLEEYAAVSIQPVEGGAASHGLVKGTLDVWSDKGKYYIPTIYYGAVYDPIGGSIVSDSTFYLVDGRLIFVHHRTLERRSDRALRFLDRVDCEQIESKRSEIHGKYDSDISK